MLGGWRRLFDSGGDKNGEPAENGGIIDVRGQPLVSTALVHQTGYHIGRKRNAVHKNETRTGS